MKNMIKGAVVAGVGVALLLGGGGTLAVWNAQVESNAGTIASGDLNLQAQNAGTWTSNVSGDITNIASYKVVPGETLTYTQPLGITLEGDNLKATLKLTGTAANKGFTATNVAVNGPTLTNTAGKVLPDMVLDDSQTVTASTTFEFKSQTSGRDSVNAAYDFSSIGYYLEQQQAPAK